MIRHANLFVVLLLWVAGLGAATQFAKIALVLPELAQEYPDAGSQIGWLVSTVSLVGAILGLSAGAMAMRIGLRRLLLAGLFFGAALSVLQASLPAMPLFLASRVLEGLSHLAIVVTAPTLIAELSSARMRPMSMVLWATFFGVAFALTAWLGLPLVDLHGVEALFLVHGIGMATVALLLARLLPRDRSMTGLQPRFDARTNIKRHVDAWSSPFIAAPAAIWLFYTITFVALLAVLPGLVPADERVFIAAALPLTSIASSLTLGAALLRVTSAERVLSIGFTAAALCSLALFFIPDDALICLALFAALGLIQGAGFALIPELNAESADRALANGVLAQAGNVGNACGTPLLITLLAVGGVPTMLALVVGCYVTALVIHLRMAGQRRQLLAH